MSRSNTSWRWPLILVQFSLRLEDLGLWLQEPGVPPALLASILKQELQEAGRLEYRRLNQ